jgi:Alpha/beta hydrolase
VYFGERYLIPRIGRWASPDPLSIHAAGGGEALNAFHYVSGNLLQARDPKGLNTLFLGGAGFENETALYAEPLVEKMRASGLADPKYVPISGPGGKPLNIARTLTYRSSADPSYRRAMRDPIGPPWAPGTSSRSTRAQDGDMLGILRDVAARSNAEGGQRNIVGYSYGTVVGAHAALELARQGTRVDNLVLVGSPISNDSDLAKALRSNDNIGRVIRIDIEGDPFSNGINLTDAPNMSRHFYFADNEHGQQEFLAKVVAAASNPDFAPGAREIHIRINPAGPEPEIVGDDAVSSALRDVVSTEAPQSSSASDANAVDQ